MFQQGTASQAAKTHAKMLEGFMEDNPEGKRGANESDADFLKRHGIDATATAAEQRSKLNDITTGKIESQVQGGIKEGTEHKEY